MREIKFRAWDKEDKCWIVDSLFIASDGVAHASVGNYFPAEIEPLDNVVLMQYTGLKDKNGKEIYEGDIVEDNRIKVRVYWDEVRNGWSETPVSIDYYGKRVIGNTYENPELLNL